MHLTPLDHSHVDPYRELMLEAYDLAADAFTTTAEERRAEPHAWWLKRVGAEGSLTESFGAWSKGELVGTVAIEYSPKPKVCHVALILGMYVKPDFRGQEWLAPSWSRLPRPPRSEARFFSSPLRSPMATQLRTVCMKGSASRSGASSLWPSAHSPASRARSTCQCRCSVVRLRPNHSLKLSANGMAHWPSGAGASPHFAPAVQRATPLAPA